MTSSLTKNWQTSNQQYGTHYGRSSSNPKPKIGRSTLEYLTSIDPTNFVHQQQKIAQKQRHGLFTQPLGLQPGDIYKDPQIYKPSKRMEVNQRMQQKVGPELFSRMGYNTLGDPYKDQFRAQQLYNKQKNDLTIHHGAFLAGGKQKLVKHSQFQHQKQYDDKVYATRDGQGNVVTHKKGIFTNNMKKGYGNTSVGHLFSQYPYQGYPEDDPRQKDSNDKLLHKAKIPTPFKGGLYPNNTFTDNFALYNNNQPYKPKDQDNTFRGKGSGNWKYNNPGKKGYNGTFTKFPQYIEEGEKLKILKKQQKIWIPNFNGTSKNFVETLARPSPPPSQLPLNQLRNSRT